MGGYISFHAVAVCHLCELVLTYPELKEKSYLILGNGLVVLLYTLILLLNIH